VYERLQKAEVERLEARVASGKADELVAATSWLLEEIVEHFK
jgi:hypothetical protein